MSEPVLVLITGLVIALMLVAFAVLAIISIYEEQRHEKRKGKWKD